MNEAEKHKHYDLAWKLIAEQNFRAALLAGAVASLLAGAVYAVATVRAPFAYGFAAAGVGVIVGLPMGWLGRGITSRFSIAAAAYAIVGCMLGNVFRVLIELARTRATTFVDALRNTPPPELAKQAMDNISLGDFVFWFVAVFSAVFLAKRPLSRSERLAIGLLRIRDKEAGLN